MNEASKKPPANKLSRSERIRQMARKGELQSIAKRKPFKPAEPVTVADQDEALDHLGSVDRVGETAKQPDQPTNVIGIGNGLKAPENKGPVKFSAPADLSVTNKPTGRPSSFNQEIADAIVQHIIGGGHMVAVKEKYGIDPGTIWSWRKKHEGFDEAVARAEEARAELWSDQLVSIADDATLDPNDKRVRIDARWKVIGSLLYRRYGVKQSIDINQKIDIGETAASVLMRLTNQAKQQRLEQPMIDVTPKRTP